MKRMKQLLALISSLMICGLLAGASAGQTDERGEPNQDSPAQEENKEQSVAGTDNRERRPTRDKDPSSVRSAPTGPIAPWLTVDIGIIGTASEDILRAATDQALEQGYQGLLIQLDTPGGALENTRNMVKGIMGSNIPVIVWVGPAGSRAGSAGAFITIAAHIAAMAPGTNIGAAHPVTATGQDVEDSELDRKIMNDTLAFIESIAKTRGRNVEMARSFVATSVSITANEALDNNVIDLLAKDVPTLMEEIDGMNVELQSGRNVVLVTQNAPLIEYERTLRQEALEILSNPNLFYLLFIVGLIGLGYELTHPGMLFPGIVGGICLILALIATSVLPISYGAAALILVGIALLVAEAFVPSFGILGIGGFVAFILGSVFLVDPQNSQGLRISLYVIAPVGIVGAAAFLGLGYLVFRSEHSPVKSGIEGLIGAEAVVITDFIGGKGQVRAAGAIWSARLTAGSAAQVNRGESLKVSGIEGLTLVVDRPSQPGSV